MADEEEQPRNVKWELAAISGFPPVVEGSVRFEVLGSGQAMILFEMRTDILIDGSSPLINDIEPVGLVYNSTGAAGKFAPMVNALREDFPRHLSHINPGPAGAPVSLCLARTGLQAIYDAKGVEGCLERLLEWFNDAKTGSFYEDGWEPVPGQSLKDCVLGYTDPKELQDYAAQHPEGGHAFHIAQLNFVGEEEDNVFIQAASPLIDTSVVDNVRLAVQKTSEENKHPGGRQTSVPAVFIWPNRQNVEEDTYFARWREMPEIIEGLKNTHLYDFADEAFVKLGPGKIFGEDSDDDKNGNRVLLLTIGLWRPSPIDSTIVGLSDDEDARHLELRTFYLVRPFHIQDPFKSTKVLDFFGLVTTTPDTMQAVSGEKPLPKAAVIGAGALGGAFVDFAVRGGSDALVVFDKDIMLSHNIARHKAPNGTIRLNKAVVADLMATNIAQDVNVTPFEDDFVTLTDDEICSRLEGCNIVVDTSANPLVRRRLSKLSDPKLPLQRSEIYHKGRLGVSLLTTIGGAQNLNMLFHQLVASAMDECNDAVREWLSYEASRVFSDEELLLGFGCSSLTTKMPIYKVDAHASAAFAIAKNRLTVIDTPLIMLNLIDEDGLPCGTQVITPSAVTTFGPDEKTDNWKVIVADPALATLHELREQSAPNETGGYLFGSIDEDASEIYILAASPEPPGTEASPSGVDLGRWGKTDFERSFLRRTRRRLPPVGTWHSHPVSDPTASRKDETTIASFKKDDAARGLPTLMAITGQDADAFYVLEA